DVDPDLRLFAAAPREAGQTSNSENTAQTLVSIEIDPSHYSSSNDHANPDQSTSDTSDNSTGDDQTDEPNSTDVTQPPSNNDDSEVLPQAHDGANTLAIPSLSEWGMMLLSLLLWLAGSYMQRRGRW
ncbi:MAG TPA: IPTL-CTERM sorting domain-containing protein, partial [Thiothrix sp.]|nr:IPTL-CTERM sorting domain-containing protein [Thiothrix sp.]